jgi:hypothetical protein
MQGNPENACFICNHEYPRNELVLRLLNHWSCALPDARKQKPVCVTCYATELLACISGPDQRTPSCLWCFQAVGVEEVRGRIEREMKAIDSHGWEQFVTTSSRIMHALRGEATTVCPTCKFCHHWPMHQRPKHVFDCHGPGCAQEIDPECCDGVAMPDPGQISPRKGRRASKCPGCNYLIVRDEGCNYMRCGNCHFPFCLKCNRFRQHRGGCQHCQHVKEIQTNRKRELEEDYEVALRISKRWPMIVL